MSIKQWSMEWGGRALSVETGKLALLTNSSCLVRYGDTVILASAVMSDATRDGIDFFPLTVNFEEKLYAAGKIKGSKFIKREGRPTEDSILSARLVDRAIRPLFDENMRNDTQVILTALSYDGETDPQVPALVAACIALSISDIPWQGNVAGVRVGRLNGAWKINPTLKERAMSDIDIVVAGNPEKIIMVEAGCNECTEDDMISAIQFGAQQMKPVLDFIVKITAAVGQPKKDINSNLDEKEIKLRAMEKEADEFIKGKVNEWIFDTPKKNRRERVALVNKFAKAIEAMMKEKEVEADIQKIVLARVKIYVEKYISLQILDKEQRLDGRRLTDIRDLYVEVGLLPRTHGTGLFQRGDTQVLSVVTLGAPGDVQTLETMEEDCTKRYMHHYNDTPATYGEVGPLRGAGNRSIGHGALAERALLPVLPDEKDFPYTIRIVSEVLGSNGSSSMASTCGSTLSLMDAGVPIKKPVAGIAMGLASDKTGRWKVLTDLQDIEDGPGGMDFKITGTKDGITAIQMDTKTEGLNWEIVKQTFKQSKEARMAVLGKMNSVISAPRAEMSQYAPRIETIIINPDKIRDVIGPGGKIINKIIDETGVQIDIEDDGRVMITSTQAEGMLKAKQWIKDLTHEVAAGEVYDGTVARIEDFGAFITILPGQDGMVHVSDMAWGHTNHPSDVMDIGDKVKVQVKEIDSLGRINLSMKALSPKPEGYVEQPPRERGFGGGGLRRSGFSGGGRSGGRGGRGGFGGHRP